MPYEPRIFPSFPGPVLVRYSSGLPPYHLNSTYTLPKLYWLARHDPDLFRRVRCILWPKDYLRFRLTGEHLTDYTEAGGAVYLCCAWGNDVKVIALTSFTEDMARRGKAVESVWISRSVQAPTPEEVMALGLGAGD